MALIRAMSRGQRKETNLDTPLAEMEAVVFDLETTGFEPDRGDAIISIGGVRIRGGVFEGEGESGGEREGYTFYRVVNPKRPIPPEIEQLTGISNAEAAGGEDLMQALHDFLNFAGKRILIAHSSAHDKAFLNAALWRTSKTYLTHRVLDTMMIAKWLEPGRTSYGLDELLADYDVEIGRRHHALQDAIMTAKLYFKFLSIIQMRQMVTLGDLYAYLSRY